ncbi:MAG: hypothetical protein U0821_00975 [Chloroflexota bacterium]
MTRQATQVYLTPEQHQALREASRLSGRSMAGIVRDLIEDHIMPLSILPTDLSDLAGFVRTGRPTDIAVERDAMLADAARDLR